MKIITKIKDNFNVVIVMAVFLFLSLIFLDEPGLYLDAVNPDYMGLHILHSDNVSIWAYSDNVIATIIEGNTAYSHFPLLNSLYGTAFEMYTQLLWSFFFGYGEYAIRTMHIVYSLLVLIGIYTFSQYILEDSRAASLATLLVAIEPSFLFSSRTQYYIQLFPHIFFFAGLCLVIRSLYDNNGKNNKGFAGAILLGLSACSYFVFAFY